MTLGVVMAIVFPAEADPALGEADQPAVGDGDPVGIATEIGQHLLGPTERALGVDDPIDPAPRSQARGEGRGVAEPRQIAAEP